MPLFAQSLCQSQISILEILNIFLRLKFSPSSTLTKIEHFSKVSVCVYPETPDVNLLVFGWKLGPYLKAMEGLGQFEILSFGPFRGEVSNPCFHLRG
jgi:hypothetical protein